MLKVNIRFGLPVGERLGARKKRESKRGNHSLARAKHLGPLGVNESNSVMRER